MRYIYAIMNALFYGISTPAMKYITLYFPIYPVILLRGLISGEIFRRTITKKEKLTKSDKKYYLLYIVSVVGGFFTYYTVIEHIDIGLFVIFTINLTMILTLVLSSIFLKEKYNFSQWLLIIIGLIALTMLSVESVNLEFNWAIIVLIINAIVSAFMNIFIKKLIDRRCNNEVYFVRTVLDVVLSLVMILIIPATIVKFIENIDILLIILVFYIGVNNFIVNWLQAKSIETIGLSMSLILKNLSTIITIMVGIMFLGESYTFTQLLLMFIFILTTILLTVIDSKRKNPKT